MVTTNIPENGDGVSVTRWRPIDATSLPNGVCAVKLPVGAC